MMELAEVSLEGGESWMSNQAEGCVPENQE